MLLPLQLQTNTNIIVILHVLYVQICSKIKLQEFHYYYNNRYHYHHHCHYDLFLVGNRFHWNNYFVFWYDILVLQCREILTQIVRLDGNLYIAGFPWKPILRNRCYGERISFRPPVGICKEKAKKPNISKWLIPSGSQCKHFFHHQCRKPFILKSRRSFAVLRPGQSILLFQNNHGLRNILHSIVNGFSGLVVRC